MALLRAGLVVSMMFVLLVVASTVSAQAHEDSSVLLRGDLDSVGRVNRSRLSGRKMLAASVPVTEHQQAPLPPTTSTATPTPPVRFATRFAFLFRSLAKGSTPPATGTPSPGHN